MLERVRKIVATNKDKLNRFIYRGSRNQVDDFVGIIIELYPSIFVIRLLNNQIRSFSYTDLLIKNLEIVL